MPLTMGFIGKFYILAAGAGSALWALVIVLVVTSTIGLYYYTRVIVAMWVQKPAEEAAGARLLPGAAGTDATAAGAAIPAISGVMLAALTAFVLVFGVYPTPLIHVIERAVSTLP